MLGGGVLSAYANSRGFLYRKWQIVWASSLDSRTGEVREGLSRSLRGDMYSIAEYAFDCQRISLHICYDHEAGLVVEAIVRVGHLSQSGFVCVTSSPVCAFLHFHANQILVAHFIVVSAFMNNQVYYDQVVIQALWAPVVAVHAAIVLYVHRVSLGLVCRELLFQVHSESGADAALAEIGFQKVSFVEVEVGQGGLD